MKKFLRKDRAQGGQGTPPKSTPSSSNPASSAATPSSTPTPKQAQKGPGTPQSNRRGSVKKASSSGAPAKKLSSEAAAEAAARSGPRQAGEVGAASREEKTAECDVLVVGAGLAGLVAAAEVARRDPTLRIRVLEARDRVGGRLHSVKAEVDGKGGGGGGGGHHHDLIRSFIHAVNNVPLYQVKRWFWTWEDRCSTALRSPSCSCWTN